ncbi:MAG TPA: hypothetical protein VFY10_10205, partial [Dehalococcoidia bacterium]|nr:hypothetical protein [Dehalococcoidia bacterium]
DDDPEVVRAAAQDQVGAYGTFPVYQAMFRAAGFGETANGYSQALIDSLVVSGSPETITERFVQMQREGAGEIMAHAIYVGTDRPAYLKRVFELLSMVSKALNRKT